MGRGNRTLQESLLAPRDASPLLVPAKLQSILTDDFVVVEPFHENNNNSEFMSSSAYDVVYPSYSDGTNDKLQIFGKRSRLPRFGIGKRPSFTNTDILFQGANELHQFVQVAAQQQAFTWEGMKGPLPRDERGVGLKVSAAHPGESVMLRTTGQGQAFWQAELTYDTWMSFLHQLERCAHDPTQHLAR